MPEVIQLCYDSLRRAAESSAGRVILLTHENISQYVDVPGFIYEKLNSGQLSRTHFADYLRIALLKKHGGLWVDASVYVSRPIDFTPEEGKIYTIKTRKESDAFVSDYRWTVSVIGCQEGNQLFCLLEELLARYIHEHKTFIDFFLFDYLIAMLYDHNADIKRMIDEIPFNNERFYHLSAVVNKPMDKSMLDNLFSSQTFHKLSWKNEYVRVVDDKPTVYSALWRMKSSHSVSI